MITADSIKVKKNDFNGDKNTSNPAQQVKPPQLPTKTEYSVNTEVIIVSNVKEKSND